MPDYTVTLRFTIPARTLKEATHRAHSARQSLLRRDAISHVSMPEIGTPDLFAALEKSLRDRKASA